MKLVPIASDNAESLDPAALAQVFAQLGKPPVGPAAGRIDAGPAAAADRIQVIDGLDKLVWTNERPDMPFAMARVGQPAAWSWPAAARHDIGTAIDAARSAGSGSFTAVTRERGQRRGWSAVVSRLGSGADAGGLILVAHDITAGAAARPAAHAGATDRPGLGDRGSLFDRLDRQVADAAPGFALVLLDIDRFGRLIERTSHACGDIVLGVLGERLQAGLGDDEFGAIMGSDEFAVVLPTNDPAAAERRTRAILDRLAAPLVVDDHDLACTLSAGYALFPRQGDTADVLCSHAATALAAAKAAGRNRAIGFDGELHHARQRRLSMLAHAECAIAGDAIVPWYQPKIDLQTGRVAGFEALLRWRSPSGLIALPGAIAAAFDDPVLAPRITEIIITRALADIVRWQRSGAVPPVAINASAADMRDPSFADRLLARLDAAGLSPSAIEIEVTEAVFVNDASRHVVANIQRLHDACVRIALDDFGTGYASLSHLKQLPIDVLKLDRSFIANLGDESGNRAIVEAMLGIARRLAIEVVAEGIETVADALFLKAAGCNLGQGFLFSRAIPAHEATRLLRAIPFADLLEIEPGDGDAAATVVAPAAR